MKRSFKLFIALLAIAPTLMASSSTSSSSSAVRKPLELTQVYNSRWNRMRTGPHLQKEQPEQKDGLEEKDRE